MLPTEVRIATPVLLRLLKNGQRFSDKNYFAFCAANPDLNVEQTAEGEIRIAPPAGGESSYRSGTAYLQLGNWANRDGRGKVFDSSVQFMLPDGSALSPDDAWVSNTALATLSWEGRRKFLRLSPEFVVEVLSPSDNIRKAKQKM